MNYLNQNGMNVRKQFIADYVANGGDMKKFNDIMNDDKCRSFMNAFFQMIANN